MPDHSPVRYNRQRPARLSALLGGVSVLALLLNARPADAGRLQQALGRVAPTVAVQQAATLAAQQAAAAAAQAQTSLGRAAAALAAMQQAQKAAATLASQASVANGIAAGGLMPQGGVTATSCGTNCTTFQLNTTDPSLWVGADTPQQTQQGGNYTVDINQTQQKAILNWDSFSIGRNTTLNFHQQSSDWIAFNRVNEASIAPSQILGNLNADGGVYVINRNGIIFGSGSQVNVHSLIASDLDVGGFGWSRQARDNYFMSIGVSGTGDNKLVFTNTFPLTKNGTSAAGDQIGGGIYVEPGANITTSLLSADAPAASIYLFGSNVYNEGTLNSQAGQVALVAAQGITLTPGTTTAATLAPNVLVDPTGAPTGIRGTGFLLEQYANSYNTSNLPIGTYSYRAGTGAVVNGGLIQTPRGTVVMNGDTISIEKLAYINIGDVNALTTPDVNKTNVTLTNLGVNGLPSANASVLGVISADTSVTLNSMVLLDAATSVNLQGVISIQPFENGETLPTGASAGSVVQAFLPAYVEMSAQNTVSIASSGLISAPSATVSLLARANTKLAADPNSAVVGQLGSTVRQVVLEGANSADPVNQPGAVIDVAGLQNVELPASYNIIAFKPTGNEFADMPLQRSGPLYNQTMWIDIRASGTRSDGTNWVGTPLGDASGFVNAVGRSIDQLMTAGGSVSLTAEVNSGMQPPVIQKSGSVVNVAGGKVTYDAGTVPATYLLGADGHIYSMANADPNRQYVGIAGLTTVDHPRWGMTDTFSWLTQSYQPGYVEGHDAGSVTIAAGAPQLGGTMYFGSVAGDRQVQNNQLPFQGALNFVLSGSVVVGQGGILASTSAVTPGTAIQGGEFVTQAGYQTVLSSEVLSSYGLSLLSIKSNDVLLTHNSANDAADLPDLQLAAGGTFSVTAGGAIDIAGRVSAPGGTISLLTNRYEYKKDTSIGSWFAAPTAPNGSAAIAADIYVEGTLDVSGRFINDAGASVQSGSAYINGGTISISTNRSTGTSLEGRGGDTTGSIVLASTSVLDASSGAYISSTGQALMAAPGVMAGAGGTIQLQLYQGFPYDVLGNSGALTPPAASTAATIEIGGTLRAYGFERNGNLAITAAKTLRIGGTPQAGDGFYLPVCNGNCQAQATTLAGLIGGGGFGSYTFTSADNGAAAQYGSGSVVVSAGADLVLRQQNLSSAASYRNMPTGTHIGTVASLTPGLAADQRKPVNVSFRANSILLDTGSRIETDPGASITFGGAPTASGGSPSAANVLVLGSILDHSGTVTVNASHIWLGSQSNIDLSGTMIANSRFGLPNTAGQSATVLSGGMLVLEQDSAQSTPLTGTFVVADQGARVDVSGYSGTVQVQSADQSVTTMDAWSDAGTVAVNSGAFVWGGTLVGLGGRSPVTGAADPRANGGTLILGGGYVVSQTDIGPLVLTNDSGAVISALAGASKPTSAASLTSLANLGLGQFAGKIEVGVDKITGSAAAPTGFENIYLYSGSAAGGAARIFTDLSTNLDGTPVNTYGSAAPVLNPLTITGSLDWSVASRLHIAASQINAGTSTGGNVSIQAPYVELTGGGSTSNLKTGTNSLSIAAQTLDIEGAAISGFGDTSGTNAVRFVSSGDMRLSTPKVADGLTTPDQSTFTGTLAAGGDLMLQAQRIYPVSAVAFTIQTPGTVTFASPQGSRTDIPLSAGGSLTVSAAYIMQQGNLFAPLGKITLGVSGITQQVTLAPGSLTSVTLADTTVPFGETQDGTNWFYNSQVSPLAQPPAKGISLIGDNVQEQAGSTIDLRGGGELQAMEWIQGKGGSRDTLATTSSGQTVYALLPASYGTDAVAAYDIHFTTARSATTPGDDYPLAGTQIRLDGGNGIPAGTYTLYPAHYATLPGALKVTYYGNNLTNATPSGTTLPDGTVLVSGHYTQSTRSQVQSFGQAMFAVQTGNVWKQYSEYSISSANSYFIQTGSSMSRLPMDAGRLAAVAQSSLLLAATTLTQPALDSNGKPLAYDSGGNLVDPSSANVFRTATVGELDVSSSAVSVVSTAADADPGHLAVIVDQLRGFGSVLIGGLRNDQGVITPTASDVVFDTRGDAFTGPELLMVAQASSGPGTVTVRSGSIIDTTQSASTLSAGRSYTDTATGALFVATNDSKLALTGPTTGTQGAVAIQGGATINTAMLTMQATRTTGAVVLDPSAVLKVNQLNLVGATVGIGASTTDSVVLGTANAAQLAGVKNLALKAFNGDITFYKNAGDTAVNFVQTGMNSLRLDGRAITGTGGDVNVVVGGEITVINSGTATGTSAAQGGTGTLTLLAEGIELGGGTQTIAGFGNVQLGALNVFVSGPGALTLGVGTDAVNLSVITPNILVGGKTVTGTGSFALATQGTVTTGGGTALVTDDIIDTVGVGGSFAVTAKAITVGNTIQAESGTILLEATSGDVTLESGGYIAARGYAKAMLDQTVYSPGGKVTLQADKGSVTAMAGSTIDVSQPTGGQGYGGEVNLVATSGGVSVGGQLLGGGGPGLGGSLKIDSMNAIDLDALAARIQSSGLTGSIDVHSRLGNLTLSSGHSLTANTVVLTADDGSAGNGVVSIAGTIDASGYAGDTADGTGQAGGQVGLYAANAITLTGSGRILARTAHADERGGDVTFGLGATAKGAIDLQASSVIDVTGGTKGGLTGGTVLLSAPLIADASGVQGRGDVAITQISSAITGARSVTVQPYVAFSTNASDGLNASSLGWNGIVDPLNNTFFTTTLQSYVQGNWTWNGYSYGFGGTLDRLIKPLVAALGPDGASIVQLTPGVNLVNPDPNINGGNITVASNWNLASGTAYSANGTKLADGSVFDFNNTAVQFNYRLVANYGTTAAPVWVVNPGALTLRATNGINVNASISDGFFQFGDYLNANYMSQVRSYLTNLGRNGQRTGIDPLSSVGTTSYLYYVNSYSTSTNQTPIPPYKSTGNSASPTSLDLVDSDLFPHALIACTGICTGSNRVTVLDPGSWSYQFTAGADVNSANPAAVRALSAGQVADVVLKGTPGTAAAQTVLPGFNSTSTSIDTTAQIGTYLSTMVRTGTGNIGVFAAGSVKLSDLSATDTAAAGVIYAAGVQTPKLTDPGYVVNGTTVSASYTGSDAFLEPRLLAYDVQGVDSDVKTAGSAVQTVFGPATAAAFPYKGGDVTVVAQRDIIGVGDATAAQTQTLFNSGLHTYTNISTYQLFDPWLMSQVGLTPIGSPSDATRVSTMGAGVYAPFGTKIATQTSWWIQYSDFEQGILSAGGNVNLTAGRNIVDVSVSLPTTGRVSGGLVSPSTGVLSTPVTHLYDSGNMAVRAGGNIYGGAFYEGSGHASILARGSVGAQANATLKVIGGTMQDLPLLAVDTGQIAMTAAGSIAFAGAVNPAELHRQLGSFADPAAATGGTPTTLTMDTYGPDSGVSLVSLAGDVTIRPTPTFSRYGKLNAGTGNGTLYPASLSVAALGGSIITQGMFNPTTSASFAGNDPGIHLSGSVNGTFELLAEGSIDLTGGYTSANRQVLTPPILPSFSAGPSLLDAAFDPYRPNSGFDESFSRPVLAEDPTLGDEIARIYAVTGDIRGVGTYVANTTSATFVGYRRLEINRPTVVRAGGNITDLNLIVQNIDSNDVSTISAGGNISYTGWFNGGGIQVAGPGYLVVQAGGNIGPFLPLSHDTTDPISGAAVQEGIVSVGNVSLTPVGNMSASKNQLWSRNDTTGIYDTALLGTYASLSKKRNELLPSTGANIISLFGVKYGIDYQAVIDAYIDPTVASGVPHKYTDELQKFLAGIGMVTSDPWTTFRDVLPQLPQGKDLQQIFVDQVFFAELKAVGIEGGYAYNNPSYGYRMIETMFPASYGYTQNALSGAGGAATMVHTGDLDLLHATIQTQHGGDISLFGPGGSILVGPLAAEPNPNLKLRDLGILSLGGGAINTFTDGNLLVNSSRVLTVLGGDILAWSSNADLNAGRGSRTTLSLPPLKVTYDSNDFQTIDPSGLVSGSGIGVLKSTTFANTSNIYLFAPRGVIDAGDAGIFSSGDIFLNALFIANAPSITAQGTTNLPTVQMPNVAAITNASSAAGSQSKTSEAPTASGSRDQASVFIVEVLGYGGGDSGGNSGGSNTGNGGSSGGAGNTSNAGNGGNTGPSGGSSGVGDTTNAGNASSSGGDSGTGNAGNASSSGGDSRNGKRRSPAD